MTTLRIVQLGPHTGCPTSPGWSLSLLKRVKFVQGCGYVAGNFGDYQLGAVQCRNMFYVGQHVFCTSTYRIKTQLRNYIMKTFPESLTITSEKLCSNRMHSDRMQLLSIKFNQPGCLEMPLCSHEWCNAFLRDSVFYFTRCEVKTHGVTAMSWRCVLFYYSSVSK